MEGSSSHRGPDVTGDGGGAEAIPRQIGKYRVESRIGGGGFGIVYRAIDPDLERRVAIKQLTLTLDHETRERFLREARIAASLRHPNIVSVYEFGFDAGRPYLVLELVDGSNLSDLIASGERLSVAKKLDILSEIAEAIAYVHEKDILHRDIKPQNVVVDALGHARLLDFGISKNPKLKSHQLTLHASFGTPGYAAPEVVLGEDATRQSDLFSFGALAYELLAGRPAFTGKTTGEINHKVVRGEREPLVTFVPHLPVEITRLVEACLAVHPSARPRDFAAVRVQLKAEAEALGRQERVAANTPTVRQDGFDQEALVRGRARASTVGHLPGESGSASGERSPSRRDREELREDEVFVAGSRDGGAGPGDRGLSPGSAGATEPAGPRRPTRFGWKQVAILLGALVLVLVLIFVVKVGKAILDFEQQFSDAISLLHEEFGINQWLAKAIAALLLVPSALGFGRGLIRRQGRRKYILFSAVYTAAFFFVIYLLGRNAAFSHRTGEARLWCAETAEGLRCFDSPGYDPKYGIALQPITPEWKAMWERRKLGLVAAKVDLSKFDELTFFDPLTGAARYWYHQGPDGSYALYDQPGFDAESGAKLHPITREVVASIRQWRGGLRRAEERSQAERARQKELAARASFRAKYLRAGTENREAVSILIFGASGSLRTDLEAAFREALLAQGIPVSNPFRSEFVQDGLARKLAEGDRDLIRRLELASACRGVLVVDVAVEDRGGLGGLSVAEALADVRFLTSSSGQISAVQLLREKGGGNNAEHARREAVAALARAVRQAELPM